MDNYITADKIIRDEMQYDDIKHEWIPFPRETREKAIRDLRAFVANSARGERRRRIMNGGNYGIPDWGIMRRLWWYPDEGKVFYCCGQDWNTEMGVLRDAFDWKRR